jgi:hypothetical protein
MHVLDAFAAGFTIAAVAACAIAWIHVPAFSRGLTPIGVGLAWVFVGMVADLVLVLGYVLRTFHKGVTDGRGRDEGTGAVRDSGSLEA